MNKEWEERSCRNCKIALGRPHSTLAQCFIIEPTDDMKPVIIKNMCSQLRIDGE